MSRSGYHNDGDNWPLICWRGAVKSGIRGARGQRLLKELLLGMDQMKDKRLISDDLEHAGEHCALGVVGEFRGLDMSNLDPEESDQIAKEFDISEALAKEIVYMNDEGTFRGGPETPEERWVRMRQWVSSQIKTKLDQQKPTG